MTIVLLSRPALAGILLLLFLVSGCQTPGGSLPDAEAIDSMPAAGLPLSKPGDRRYFSNGRRERVIDIENGQATWRRSGSTHYVSDRNFIIPESYRESSRRTTTHQIEGDPAQLWPMQVGVSGRFIVRRTAMEKETGTRKTTRRDWSCQVDKAERITVIAGTFDVHRVRCSMSDEMGKFKKRRYWYYAPDIEQVVLQIKTRRSKAPERLELTAFRPAIPETLAVEYRQFFQEIMEKRPSGKRVRWEVTEKGLLIDVTPTRTLRLEDNTYCRNYRMKLRMVDGIRQGAGMVCRDERGRWRVPRRVEGY